MEQNYLVIDCSVSPAQIAVVAVASDRASVVESFTHDLIRSVEFESPSSEDSSPEEIDHSQDNVATGPLHSRFDQAAFESLLSKVSKDWEESLIIIPPSGVLFLNLTLPFSDRKTVQKVLPLETQDLIPFDISEFHIDFSIRRTSDGGAVRASLIPQEQLEDLLSACRPAGLEPSLIIPPSAAGAGLVPLIPGLEKGCVGVVYGSPEIYSVLILKDGVPTYERLISCSSTTSSQLSELLLSFRSTAASVDGDLTHIFTIGEVAEAEELAAILGVEVTEVATESNLALAQLSAVLLSDYYTGILPTNFRSGAFSYSPLMKELARGGKALIPVSLRAALLAGVVLLGTYITRGLLVRDLEATVRQQILTTVPTLAALPGEELTTLKNQIQSLQAQLQDLGSPSELSALDVLADIAKYVPVSEEVSIRKVNIKGDRVVIEGTAPDYSAVDRIEKSLRRRKQIFCRLRREQASSGGAVSQRGFLFDFRICS